MKILSVLSLILCLTSPSQAASASIPAPYKAEYRLILEDRVVGRAFFSLTMDRGGRYRSEVYTIPDGEKASREPAYEILEESIGHFTGAGVVPDRYVYSTRRTDEHTILEFLFDWKEKQFTAQNDSNKATSPLEAGTQDRLSYLLQIRHNLLNRHSDSRFLIAEPEQARLSRFLARGQKRLKLPIGPTLARKVERLDENHGKPELLLWFAKDYDQMPVLLEKQTENGEVRMELMSYKRQ